MRFADECEAISGRTGHVLKGIVNAQIAGFVQGLGTTETERVAKNLDSDTWNVVDFTDSDEEILQRVLSSMSADPPKWSQSATPIWEDISDTLQLDQRGFQSWLTRLLVVLQWLSSVCAQTKRGCCQAACGCP